MKQRSFYNEPLHSKDSEDMTFGCRQTTPENCARNSLPDICAFVREDNICLSPPNKWRRKFKELEK
jgi:hypothetical protein